MFNQGWTVEIEVEQLKVTDHCHLHRYTCTTSEIVCPNCFLDIKRGISCLIKVKGHGQRLTSQIIVTSIGVHVPHLKLFAQTVLDILQGRAIFMCLIKVKGHGQRRRSQITVISIGVHLQSLKLLVQIILEILRKRAIFMCFINHVISKWPLTFTSMLNLNTKMSLISGKT